VRVCLQFECSFVERCPLSEINIKIHDFWKMCLILFPWLLVVTLACATFILCSFLVVMSGIEPEVREYFILELSFETGILQ
jgi:hypothetical protein